MPGRGDPHHPASGVAPLLSWLEEGLSGWSVADRVVGAGAAWLYTLLHPAMVYAPVMSRRATAILTQYGVPYTCDEVAESILNRTGTGLCPMEEATADAADPSRRWRPSGKRCRS